MKNFNTDKYSHGYVDFYEPYFESMYDAKNILEIGIHNGESLKYLSSKFPNANIYGIDLYDKSNCNTDKIKTFIVNQEDRNELNNFLKMVNVEFDVILDDGGHTMKQQQISFGALFEKIKNGGIYIIEDLHTSRIYDYISHEDLITSLDMLFNFKYTKNLISNHITEEEKRYIIDNVKNIKIWTRTPNYDESVTSIIRKK
jgi:hypothetical protein